MSFPYSSCCFFRLYVTFYFILKAMCSFNKNKLKYLQFEQQRTISVISMKLIYLRISNKLDCSSYKLINVGVNFSIKPVSFGYLNACIGINDTPADSLGYPLRATQRHPVEFQPPSSTSQQDLLVSIYIPRETLQLTACALTDSVPDLYKPLSQLYHPCNK